MSTVTINNSPIHSDSTLTAVYGETGSNWARFHTGIDFVPYGSTEANLPLYSCCQGEIVEVNLTPNASLGNNVVIKESQNKYWRYCHMVTGSLQVSVGDIVNLSSVIGIMGATGNVTGVHLHLECATTQAWNYDTFLNPASELGIPNERGTIIIYDGSVPPTPPPVPPEPTDDTKKCKFPWVLYANKFRKKY